MNQPPRFTARFRPSTETRHRVTMRATITAAIAALLSILVAVPSGAHGVGESTKAVELVQQAIAYLVNEPDNLMAAEEKVNDALKTSDQKGVDRDSLTAAKRAIKQGDGHRGRAFLERSIGARPHLSGIEPLPVRHVPTEPATGAASGTKVVTDPLPGRGALDGGAWALLIASALLALGGAVAAWRFRPAHKRVATTAAEV